MIFTPKNYQKNRGYVAQVRESKIVFSATDRVSRVVDGIGKNLGTLDKRLGTIGRNLQNVGQVMMFDMASRLKTITTGLLDPAKEFQSAMIDVTKTFDEESFKKLGTSGKQLEDLARTIGKSMKRDVSEVAKVMAGLTTAKTVKDLEEITRLGMMLGTAFDLDATESKEALGSIFKQTDQNVQKTKEFADTVNYLSNVTKSNVKNLLEFGQRSMGVANVVGMATDDMLAFGNVWTNLAVAPDMAFTAYKNMTNAFSKAVKPSKDLKKALADIGLTGQGLAKSFSKEQTGTILYFLETLDKIQDPVQKSRLGGLFFGQESWGNIAKLIPKLAVIRNDLKLSRDEQGKLNSLVDEYGQVTQSAVFKQRQAEESLKNMKESFGRFLLPMATDFYNKIADIATKVADWADKNPKLAKSLATVTVSTLALATGLAGLGVAMGAIGIATSGIGGALRTVFSLGKGFFTVSKSVETASKSLIGLKKLKNITGLKFLSDLFFLGGNAKGVGKLLRLTKVLRMFTVAGLGLLALDGLQNIAFNFDDFAEGFSRSFDKTTFDNAKNSVDGLSDSLINLSKSFTSLFSDDKNQAKAWGDTTAEAFNLVGFAIDNVAKMLSILSEGISDFADLSSVIFGNRTFSDFLQTSGERHASFYKKYDPKYYKENIYPTTDRGKAEGAKLLEDVKSKIISNTPFGGMQGASNAIQLQIEQRDLTTKYTATNGGSKTSVEVPNINNAKARLPVGSQSMRNKYDDFY